ncbi:DNA-binding MarR family transcriptional regulator [Aureimonas phyllosphaerae]|uniref:DNA-binding MarR family transcriptional regulator n=1 Tax=Aureimonas phyllosphaerae TaxID=1166078 RepID=A0A7W6FW25_9HYPH|nr:DNA-binding MarR family transcriptional regulator [Aureimonas phyllosphaerae]MBB3961724.1 DNA-binding MarR family transcriptional regulator [Aureimonas phyllosphaerae]
MHRTVDPANGRQVIIALTDEGKALRSRAGCFGDTLLEASGQTPAVLARLNGEISQLRAAVYDHIGEWSVSDTTTDTA